MSSLSHLRRNVVNGLNKIEGELLDAAKFQDRTRKTPAQDNKQMKQQP